MLKNDKSQNKFSLLIKRFLLRNKFFANSFYNVFTTVADSTVKKVTPMQTKLELNYF